MNDLADITAPLADMLDEHDEPPPDLDAPRRKLIDPRTLPARFHHLRAAGQSGAHCFHAFQGDASDSLAKRLGSGVHALLFLPETVAIWGRPSEASVKRAAKAEAAGEDPPPLTPAPRSGKEWLKFVRDNPGRVILTAAERNAATSIVDAIRNHPVAARLLFGPGMTYERSIVWAELGRARQSTPDARGRDHLVELKTTRCAAPWRFVMDASKMGYHAQLADQRAAIAYEQGGRSPREVYIVAVENVPPYVVQVYELTPTTLELGDKLRTMWLERLQMYEATNLWGGYSPGIEPLEILHDIGPAIADPEWAEDAGKEAAPT